MTTTEEYLRLVKLSAQRALEGQTPANLRALSVAVDVSAGKIFLRAHFFASPSEDDLDDISVAETEIDADFLDYLTAETEVEIAPPNTAPRFLAGGVAYLRDAPG